MVQECANLADGFAEPHLVYEIGERIGGERIRGTSAIQNKQIC